ncbi:MAG: bacteriohemerythrin [Planctomycetota bacterium]
MPLITWDQSLSVGVPDLDAQHRRLVDMINDLHDAMAKGQGRDALKPLLTRLAQYTVTHFQAEEQYMRKINYPNLLQHKAEHENLVRRVKELTQSYESNQIALTIETMNFLRDWLTSHIRRVDRQYAPTAAQTRSS